MPLLDQSEDLLGFLGWHVPAAPLRNVGEVPKWRDCPREFLEARRAMFNDCVTRP